MLCFAPWARFAQAAGQGQDAFVARFALVEACDADHAIIPCGMWRDWF